MQQNYFYHLLLGSNLGKPEELLAQARTLLSEIGIISLKSSIYSTEPWGGIIQNVFLNQILIFQSSLEPLALLRAALQIEEQMGRIRNNKYGPRTIDIDILFCENHILHLPELTLPHPQIPNRAFVLVPMVELDPDFIHPITQLTMREQLAICTDTLAVNKTSLK